MSHAISWRYTPAELWADGFVHAAGVSLAIGGAAVLLLTRTDIAPGDLAAASVYLATLLISIGLSAAYNLWPVGPVKWYLRRFDHAAIFLLIAGTYTPFMVRAGTPGFLLFVWLVAACGVALKLLRPGRFDRLAVLLYLAMGWSGIFAWNTLASRLTAETLALVVIGGALYSVGTIFHLWERLKFQNAIWHAFVLCAACVHYCAVWSVTPIA